MIKNNEELSLTMLRRLASEDFTEVLTLLGANDPYKWPENIWFNSLKNDWVMGSFCAQGKLTGLAVVQFNPFDAELLYIFVSPEQRQQGLAKQLLMASLNQCKAEGAERLMLEVRVSNTNAINLYKSFGFEQDGKRKNYYPLIDQTAKEDALLFSRWLV